MASTDMICISSLASRIQILHLRNIESLDL